MIILIIDFVLLIILVTMSENNDKCPSRAQYNIFFLTNNPQAKMLFHIQYSAYLI